MAPANIQASLLLALRRLLSWILKGCPNLIGYFWGSLCRHCSWLKACWIKPKSPLSPLNPDSDVNTLKTMIPYAVAKDGDAVSFDMITASQDPVSNGGVQNTLESSASGDSYHVPLPLPTSNSSSITSRPQLHLVPRHKRSAPMPHLRTQNGSGIEVEIASPTGQGNQSQDGLHILPILQHSSHGPHVETVNNPTEPDQTMSRSPPSPGSLRNRDLSHSNDCREDGPRSYSDPHSLSTSRPSNSLNEERYPRPVFPVETQRSIQRAKLCVLYFHSFKLLLIGLVDQ